MLHGGYIRSPPISQFQINDIIFRYVDILENIHLAIEIQRYENSECKKVRSVF